MGRRLSWPGGEAIFTLVLLLIGIIAFVATFDIRYTRTTDPFGPRLMPQFLSLAVIIGSGVMLVRLFLAGRGAREDAPGENADKTHNAQQTADPLVVAPTSNIQSSSPASPMVEEGLEPQYVGPVPKRLALFIAVAIYVAAMSFVGFRISTFLFGTMALWLMGERSKRVLFIMPIVMSLFLYYLFEFGFAVRLP